MQRLLRVSPARRNRTLLVLAAAVAAGWFVFQARGAVFPFLLGIVLAYLLLPMVRWIEGVLPLPLQRRGVARTLAVLIVYLVGLTVLGLTVAFLLPFLIDQVTHFLSLLPETTQRAQQQFVEWTERYQASVPPEVQRWVEDTANGMARSLSGSAQAAVGGAFAVISQTFSLLLGLVTVPVWLFYVLKDEHRAKRWLRENLPAGTREEVAALARIVDRVLSSYVRAQLLLGVAVGVLTTVGLTLVGIPFAVVLGLIAGVTELIPVLGPVLGSVPGILVTLANAPDRVLWAVLVYVLVQQIENNLLVPRVQGNAVQIHPAVIMVLLVLASEVAGVVGMLVAVPLAAVARSVFLHLYKRYETEERSELGSLEAGGQNGDVA